MSKYNTYRSDSLVRAQCIVTIAEAHAFAGITLSCALVSKGQRILAGTSQPDIVVAVSSKAGTFAAKRSMLRKA